jgi:hypothetical protein
MLLKMLPTNRPCAGALALDHYLWTKPGLPRLGGTSLHPPPERAQPYLQVLLSSAQRCLLPKQLPRITSQTPGRRAPGFASSAPLPLDGWK